MIDKKPSNQVKDSDPTWWKPHLALFMRLNYWIAFPVIASLFLGSWIDKKYDSEPWGIVSLVGLALVVSTFGIIKEAVSSMNKAISEESNSEKK